MLGTFLIYKKQKKVLHIADLFFEDEFDGVNESELSYFVLMPTKKLDKVI